MATLRRLASTPVAGCGVTAPPSRFEAEVAALEACLAAAAPIPRPLVVYGSSTVRLWPDPGRDLARDDVIAVGFGGARLADLAHWHDRLVAPLSPSTLVIAAGANDLDAPSVSALDLIERMAALVDLARLGNPALAVFVLTLKPSPELDAQMSRILEANDALLRRFTRSGTARLIDTCTPFLTPEGRADARFYAEDRRHMNAAGYARWSRCLTAALPMPVLHT